MVSSEAFEPWLSDTPEGGERKGDVDAGAVPFRTGTIGDRLFEGLLFNRLTKLETKEDGKCS
jgi:hypothetical protein